MSALYSIDDDVLSQSKINAYRRCGYAYQKAHEEHLVPRVDRPAPALGSAVHFGTASGLRGGNTRTAIQTWFDETMGALKKQFEPTAEEFSQYLVIKDLAAQIADRNLQKFYDEKWELVTLKGVPLIEYAFLEPLNIGKWKTFRGTVDLVAKDRTGMPWLIDWKVRSSFVQDQAEETNLQMAAYQYLLAREGVEAAGSISWQISDDMPRPPNQNKDGRFSRQLIRSTWGVYAATVKMAGQDPNDYLDMRDKLSTVEWYRLSKAYRNKREVEAVWNEIVLPSAREMDFQSVKRQYIRNFHFINCGTCAYRDLCLEDLRGGDTQFIRDVRFRDSRQLPTKSPALPDFIED